MLMISYTSFLRQAGTLHPASDEVSYGAGRVTASVGIKELMN